MPDELYDLKFLHRLPMQNVAGHIELQVEGHTMPFAKAFVPRFPPPPLDGMLVLRRDKRTDHLFNAWHASRAKKNCTLSVYNTHGGLVGRYSLMGAQVVKIETEQRSASFAAGPSRAPDILETVTFTYQKIEH